MTGPGAEMPFLDHLEELRARLVRVVTALIIGCLIGYWVVQHFQLVSLLAAPIAPYLKVTGGKLTVTSPTEPVMIVLKLALVVGIVLTSPLIIYQIWAFMAPALYARERRVIIPALIAGTGLFLSGAAFGYLVLLPRSLPILFSFQSDGLAILITYEKYFGFVLQLVLAMGLCFEIPLVIMLLTALGVITPVALQRFRRFAIVLSCVAGAVLSPGTDVLSMILMTVPILLLYEIGYAGSWLIHRAKLRSAAATAALVLVALLLGSTSLSAQADSTDRPRVPRKPKPTLPVTSLPIPIRDTLRSGADTGATDSLKPRPGQAVDTATARRLGLPTAPRHPFAPDDSVLTELLARPGYQSTRFRSDSAIVFAEQRRLLLRGEASTRRGETTLEADSIAYQESSCLLRANGNPALFDKETVLSGFGGIRYNTCIKRGIVSDALTSFKQGSTDWFLRGNLAQDSSGSRLYASEGEITSCDLPEPHYHFSAREVKWISRTMMVARPAVLYIRDVPILWLPFIFQDARPGRRSGILIPRFGLNDIVRQNPGYNRQVTNVGYYWAPNEYFDLTGKLDWYANRYVQYGVAGQYRVLNRFLSGAFGYSRTAESGGGRSTNLRWDHRQNFDLSTSLNLSVNYTSSGFIQRRNAIDPLQSTQQITSSANFSKRYNWGTITLGGNRRQSLSDKSVTMQLPSFSVSPKPIDIARDVTWSPALTLNNNIESNFPITGGLLVALPGGGLDTLVASRDRRTTTISFDTPIRFGGFSWRNSFNYSDFTSTGVITSSVKVPDPTTPDPTDSITVSQVAVGDFQSDLDWNTGINLPTLLRRSWKVQPSVGIVNATSAGAFLVRSPGSGGSWVRQGKRFNLGVSASPTFFGFFPGFGPIQRFRHSISPIINYSYSPAASIPRDYAQAIATAGQVVRRRSDPSQLLSIGLSQNFEGKARKAATDTSSADNARKFRVLGVQTSSIQFDFERAKQPGLTGWRTDALTNQFQSDLLPGFSLSLTHDLWRGPVGTDSAHFSPFLQSVTTGFAISGSTVRTVLGLVGLGGKQRDSANAEGPPPPNYVAGQSRNGRRSSFDGFGADQTVGLATNHRFTANFNYSYSRQRPESKLKPPPTQQSLGFSTNFSPTPFWTVSWSTQYNITDKKFESQVVRLERVLHEWRAGFNFVRNPNGNFAFFFSVYLSDLPDLKFDYNQTSIER
ncbi:MAG: twin-arginine translocase subunit TatC [Gemmatimonadota bacterium]|nr:twin-arginine translocase subunit TatC [Gemmatimonadota bacterium]